jgi:SAM-dependent methyltransferase
VDGIWRLLSAERSAHHRRFQDTYAAVRRHENWGSSHESYYQMLPDVARNDPQRDIWRIRAGNYRTFVTRVLQPLESQHGRPLAVLDLGAGNGWLAHRISRRGHRLVALDLSVDARDGLGVRVYYDLEPSFLCLQAEFDRLPLAGSQADLIIFNGSIHYAENVTRVLAEALRVLTREGLVVFLDTPFFRDARSGTTMVREGEERWAGILGSGKIDFRQAGFLTPDNLTHLADDLNLVWNRLDPHHGIRWLLWPWVARLRGMREPARFPIIVGRRSSVLP